MLTSKILIRTASAATLLIAAAGPAMMSAQTYQYPYGVTGYGQGTYDLSAGQYDYQYQYGVQYAQAGVSPQALTPVYDPDVPDSKRVYLQCMQAAVQRRENDTIQVQSTYHQQYEAFLQARMQARLQIWTISDDRDRRDEERRLERDFREDERDLESDLDDRMDDIEDRYRDDRRDCDRQKRDNERRERDQEREADRTIRTGGSINTTGSFPTGVNCRPYVCSNGRTYPTCTAQGYPINYFANPCVYN